MIIHRIQASNVLKYASLQLDELPESGVIAISGPNESGKSSIGETVCFALFGRTFSIAHDDLTKVIRWDQSHCSAELDFSNGDGKRYRIERFLDRSGNHSACLSVLVDGKAEALARGVDDVNGELYDLMGHEYDEFVESFYLAQREITTPHPHSFTLKNIAGVITLEYCSIGLNEDIEGARAAIEESQGEVADVTAQIDEIALEPALLSELMTQRSRLVEHDADSKARMARLENASTGYQEALQQRTQALKTQGRSGIWRLLTLLLFIVPAGLWGLLTQMPDHELALLASAWLGENVPYWQSDRSAWLLYAAGGFFLLFIIAWSSRSMAGRRAQEQGAAAATLVAELRGLDERETVTLPADKAEQGQEEGTAEQQSDGETPEATMVDSRARELLCERVGAFSATQSEVQEAIAAELAILREGVASFQARMDELDEAIQQEQQHLEHFTSLQTVRGDLNATIKEREEYIKACALADELVQGAVRNVSNQFNVKLRELVSKTLPLFTDNRYEHLQIAEDLTVRAFSSEKRDFMDLAEISSGTQRQIMLAVRIALSEELVRRTGGGRQFLFLDEPFAFFDKKRMRGSLEVLPGLSDELKQIWIIAQEFPADMAFDTHIECERDYMAIPAAV